ncbi:MAG: glycosyltransferase family 39 protein [Clostridia bacterium]|nr:glycosyltransferase family 39 protein [Clostridia bacterium]
MTSKKKTSILLLVTMIISLSISIFFIYNKQGYHEDELLTFNLANSSCELSADGEWYSFDDFNSYLSVSDSNRFDYTMVYENQIKDGVHPPLYYFLFHSICSLFPDIFSKWFSFFLNGCFMMGAIYFLFKTAALICRNNTYALLSAIAYAMSLACITTTIYIRMYAMLTFFVVLFSYMTLFLYRNYENVKTKHFVIFCIVAFLGNLTHYYFILFEVLVGITLLIITIKRKGAFSIKKYIIAGVLAAVASLAVYPFIITNVLSGNRGLDTGNISIDFITILTYGVYKIRTYMQIISKEIFINQIWLFVLCCVLLLVSLIYTKFLRKTKICDEAKIIFIPALIFLIGIMIASPFNSDRYIMAVMPFVVMIFLFGIAMLLKRFFSRKIVCIVLTTGILLTNTLALFTVSPYYTYGKTNLYDKKTDNCVFVGTSMMEWNKSIDKLMQYDNVMMVTAPLNMGFMDDLDSFANGRGVVTNGKIDNLAKSFIDSANSSSDDICLDKISGNTKLSQFDDVTLYISQLCDREYIINYVLSNTDFTKYEIIQEDYDFNDFFNWYDYFAETESYCNVYRFYK